MIKTENGVFFLETKNTSYLFRVTSRGHLEHIHYGARVSSSDAEALCLKNTIMLGTTVAYDAKDTAYSVILPFRQIRPGRRCTKEILR